MASTVWRGYITFGLISIPVRLFRAARPERVNLKQLYRVQSPQAPRPAVEEEPDEPEQDAEPVAAPSSRTAGGTLRSGGPQPVPYRVDRSAESGSAAPTPEVLAPVRRVAVDQSDESIVPQRALTKGYEYEKDRFVALDPEELKSIVPKTATEMEILEFVKLDDIDPVYFEASYYVRPEGAGEKPYALLYKSLQKTRLVAIARFAMHSREHIVVLRPGKGGLISHTMYFQSEVRAEQEYRADTDLIEARDLDLAEKLIHSLAAEFEPQKYKDTYREKLEALIQSKVEGKRASEEPAPSKRAPVVDMTEALRRSLALVKKPPHSEGEIATDSGKSASTRKRAGRARAQAK